jgi:hypothetical protein
MALKLHDIRALVSEKEFDRFGNFTRSPFFNSEPRFIKLFELLKSSKDVPAAEVIAETIFGDTSARTEPRFRKLTSEFMRLFERFLSELEFEKDTYRQTLGASEQLNKREASAAALAILKQPVETLEKMPMKDEILLNRLLEMYSLQYSIVGQDFKNMRNDMSYKMNDCLDEFFVTYKSFLLARMASLEKVFHSNENAEKSFVHCLRKYAGGGNTVLSATNSDAYMRYLIYELMRDEESEELRGKYIAALAQAEDSAPGKCKTLYADLMNHYSHLVNTGKKEYEPQIIAVGRVMEEKRYFESAIANIEIATIVESAIGSKEFDWALGFLERMRNKITEANRESIYAAYSAKLCFFKKDFANARRFTSYVELNDYLSYSESKLLECRMLYEDDLIDVLMLVIDKISKYLKSHKEIGTHYLRAYSLFLEALKNLARVRERIQHGKPGAFELSKLKTDLQKPGPAIYAQAWLIDKISEIEKAG